MRHWHLRDDTVDFRSSKRLNVMSLAGMIGLLVMMAVAQAAFDPPKNQQTQPAQKPAENKPAEDKPAEQKAPEQTSPQAKPAEQPPAPEKPPEQTAPPQAKPETAPAAEKSSPSQKPATGGAPATALPPELTDKDKEKETERFVPSQKTSADNSATFPVDI